MRGDDLVHNGRGEDRPAPNEEAQCPTPIACVSAAPRRSPKRWWRSMRPGLPDGEPRARRVERGEGSYPSITRLKTLGYFGVPKVRASRRAYVGRRLDFLALPPVKMIAAPVVAFGGIDQLAADARRSVLLASSRAAGHPR
jgi:hypothetical protein